MTYEKNSSAPPKDTEKVAQKQQPPIDIKDAESIDLDLLNIDQEKTDTGFVSNLLNKPLDQKLDKRSNSLNPLAKANKGDSSDDKLKTDSGLASDSADRPSLKKRKMSVSHQVKDLVTKLWDQYDDEASGLVDKIEA